MFDRSLLKANAKIPLKSTYWTAFGVSAVFIIVSGVFSGSGASSGSSASTMPPVAPPYFGGEFMPPASNGFADFAILGAVFTFVMGAILFATLLGMVFTFFVRSPLEVGKNRFFVYNRRYPTDFATLFSNFKANSYLNGVKILAVRDIKIALWSLLFLVPGIIKSYQYQMVAYILTENPTIDIKRAFAISKGMTDDHKLDLFVLDLSFWGWFFLGILACGLGLFFVYPYYEATKAEAYEFLKQEAISKGVCHPAEFAPQQQN